MRERIAGARYAFRTAHPAAPMLRVRYRHGVPVDPYGFPDWTPYARAVVALPPAIADLTVDEARVVDLRAADSGYCTPVEVRVGYRHNHALAA